MQPNLKFSLLSCVLMSVASAAAAQSQQDSIDADIVAAQVRTQGYECKMPDSVIADPNASTPDEKVWILTCEDAKYRVRLVPDMAADIEQIN